MMRSAALLCVASLVPAVAGSALDTDSIRTAVTLWLSDSAAAEAAYGHISTWETGAVTDMSCLFVAASTGYCDYVYNAAAASFNEDIGAWDTSGVTTMRSMFYQAMWQASAFNQDIGAWETSRVKDMFHMFRGASSFNQDISDWPVHSVTSMEAMFYYASSFDQDLGWCLNAGVLDYTFDGAPCSGGNCGVAQKDENGECSTEILKENSIRTAVWRWLRNATAAEATYGHISTWETGAVTNMRNLFNGASSFNEDIGAWDTSGVKSTLHMFRGARAFNRNISGWAVHKVGCMYGMFRGANAFNQDIGGWAVDSVSDMGAMFRGAKSFDQDLGWCVDAKIHKAFEGTKCEATSCGVKKEAFGTCDEGAIAGIITAIVLSCLIFLLAACFCCYYKTKVRAVAPTTSEEAPAPPASTVRVVDAPAAGIAPNELGTVVAVEQPEEEL